MVGVQLCVSFTGQILDESEGGGATRVYMSVITRAAACHRALGDSAYGVCIPQSAHRRVLEGGRGGTYKSHLARRAKNNKGNLGSSEVHCEPLCAGQ